MSFPVWLHTSRYEEESSFVHSSNILWSSFVSNEGADNQNFQAQAQMGLLILDYFSDMRVNKRRGMGWLHTFPPKFLINDLYLHQIKKKKKKNPHKHLSNPSVKLDPFLWHSRCPSPLINIQLHTGACVRARLRREEKRQKVITMTTATVTRNFHSQRCVGERNS